MGQIEPSDSPWSSPVTLVTKKDGGTWFCVDYHRLNDVTVKDAYPLPRIHDTLDMLAGKQWFSTLDLASRYCQVSLSQEARVKTAFYDAFQSVPVPSYFWDTLLVGEVWSATRQRLRTSNHGRSLIVLKSVLQFLGCVGYYQRFIPNFADVATPLVTLTGKDVPCVWDAGCSTAFSVLRASHQGHGRYDGPVASCSTTV